MRVQDLAQWQACAATIKWWFLSLAVVGTTCTMLGKWVANEEAPCFLWRASLTARG